MTPPVYRHDIVEQFDALGFGSLTVVLLTGLFTGAALASQTGITLDQFGARPLVGRLVSASMVIELGPVLTALMLTGRIGSGIAAELGSMVVTDQINALRALGTDPIRKLVVPRMLAGLFMAPALTIISDLMGIFGGWVVARFQLQVSSALYWSSVTDVLYVQDLEGPHQAVRLRLPDRDGRLLRRPPHQWRHAGRRQGDDHRGRGRLGRRHRSRLLRHPVPRLGDLLMQTAREILNEPGAPVVLFDRVQLAFDEKVVLRNLSFSLMKGHTKIILGASGSGKSTILKIITGLLRSDAGVVWVNGQRVDQLTEAQLMDVRNDLGMIFQEGALFDSLTVRENVGYKTYEESDMPLEQVDARVKEVLGFIGLAEHLDKMPSELSGGQRRRVAIARAMAFKPRILLYDEATTGLDPITAITVNDEIIKLRDFEGVSSIVVTHQLRDAFYVATHMAVRDASGQVRIVPATPEKCEEAEFIMVKDGVICFEGTADELRRSTDPYLQTFLS